MMSRISLFAVQEREERRSKIGDPLVGRGDHVDFEALAERIDTAPPGPSRARVVGAEIVGIAPSPRSSSSCRGRSDVLRSPMSRLEHRRTPAAGGRA